MYAIRSYYVGFGTVAAAAVEVEGDAYAGVFDKYLWRGFDLSGSQAVAQGGVDLSAGGFTLSFWSNAQLSNDAGEGSERSTIYLIDVFSDGQETGCGKDDRLIRLRVGGLSGKLAQKAIPWQAGLTRFDIVFGENVTPKPT